MTMEKQVNRGSGVSGLRLVVVGVACGLIVLVTGAACSSALSRLGLVRPTATPTLPPPTPTLAPTLTPTPLATLLIPTRPQEGDGLDAIPSEPDSPFTIALTEQELNDYLAERTFSQSGVSIRDVQVTVTDDALIAAFQTSQAESGLSAGVTVRGVPQVADGELYFRVDDVTLDESIGGFARVLASAAINQAVEQYSTEHGIPVPIENIAVEEITLDPGLLTVTGRTE
jgi:hypothetical protein